MVSKALPTLITSASNSSCLPFTGCLNKYIERGRDRERDLPVLDQSCRIDQLWLLQKQNSYRFKHRARSKTTSISFH